MTLYTEPTTIRGRPAGSSRYFAVLKANMGEALTIADIQNIIHRTGEKVPGRTTIRSALHHPITSGYPIVKERGAHITYRATGEFTALLPKAA